MVGTRSRIEKEVSMPETTLRDLYQSELSDLYAAEQQIIASLPQMASAVSSSDLRAALERHLERTRIHVERLDLLFQQHGLARVAAQSSGLSSLVEMGSARIRQHANPDVRDAAIIGAAQHIEHYEMAGYGCARTYARQLGEDRAADLLQQTLDEEGAADKELTRLAESGINRLASAGDVSDERSARLQSRLRYVAVDDLSSAADYRDLRVRNRAGDDLGRIDGFVADASGRPYYMVVDSGGLFVGRRYIVPIGKTDLRRSERLIDVDLSKDTLKRYPEFHRDAFLAMSDEEARRYEWRVLEAIDPQAARTATTEWSYDEYAYYRRPDWFDTEISASRSVQRDTAGAARGEVPISTTEDERERERVLAREHSSPPTDDERERLRGTSEDKIR
jgi:ferritin-like metal-binding protein YciE